MSIYAWVFLNLPISSQPLDAQGKLGGRSGSIHSLQQTTDVEHSSHSGRLKHLRGGVVTRSIQARINLRPACDASFVTKPRSTSRRYSADSGWLWTASYRATKEQQMRCGLDTSA
ncbi:hypothetical protein BKA80DRAFT_110184 [Phyllosticta citrichinensis]